jgi:DNA-binding transcriptional LysR family regulator
MDRFSAMALLVATVDCGSFSGAARKLDLPIATVARKIGELEASLNTRLLLRTTRTMALTEAGIAYVEACRRILDAVDDAEREVAGEYLEPRGELVITAPMVFGRLNIVPLSAHFLQLYPDIVIRLNLADRVMNLPNEHIDLAIRVGALPDSSLMSTRLGSCRRVVCASPAYLDAHTRPQEPDDLAGHICVTFESLAAGRPWTFRPRDSSGTQCHPPKSRLVVTTADAAISAAVEGVGVAHVLSYQIARLVREGRLEIVLQPFEPAPIPINLVYLNKAMLPAKIRKFLDIAVPSLRATLAKNDEWVSSPGIGARSLPAALHA